MKPGIILIGIAVLLNTACSTITLPKADVCRTASVALIPPESVEAVRVELEASGDIQRGGLYLREIDGDTYLFQYLEVASRDGHKPFQCLDLRYSESAFCTQKEVKRQQKLGGGSASFQGLEPTASGHRFFFQGLAEKLGAGSACMERIFYEAGAADKTSEGDVMRIAMFTELKPEKEKDYRLLHANPWPDVIAAIKKANFRHFSIFLEEIDGKVYLFGWLEYVGSDIAADDAINKQDPASIRWWKETDACQIAPDDAGDGMWGGMKEILFSE